MVKSNQSIRDPTLRQDDYIESRINKLFFAEALKQLQQKR